MPSPQYTAAWVLNSQTGIESLNFLEQLPLPPMKEDEILVKIHAASLNYRELLIAEVKIFPCSISFSL
jgi:NADPH:quinone reductase-like Zn-dependent oxidoreductase